ncbi:MAG: hypothetical protein AAF378_10630 [Cyanobacteria bacterium P01_A01_bin.84]
MKDITIDYKDNTGIHNVTVKYPDSFADITVKDWMGFYSNELKILKLYHEMDKTVKRQELLKGWVEKGEDDDEMPYNETFYENEVQIMKKENSKRWKTILKYSRNQVLDLCPEVYKHQLERIPIPRYKAFKDDKVFQERFLDSDFKIVEYESDITFKFHFPEGVKTDLAKIDEKLKKLDKRVHEKEIVELELLRERLAEGEFIVYHAKDIMFQAYVEQDFISKFNAVTLEEDTISALEEFLGTKRTKDGFSLTKAHEKLVKMKPQNFESWKDYEEKLKLKETLEEYEMKSEDMLWKIAPQFLAVVTCPVELEYSLEEAKAREKSFENLTLDKAKDILAFFLALNEVSKKDLSEYSNQTIRHALKRLRSTKKSGDIFL